MPPKNKATGRSAKKGKAARKTAAHATLSDFESDATSGDDEPSVRDMLKGLSSMMSSLNTRMDEIEGDG